MLSNPRAKDLIELYKGVVEKERKKGTKPPILRCLTQPGLGKFC